jgi:FixJ family two-component response regulator
LNVDEPDKPLVYLVDDDAALRDSLRWLLEAAGHGVVSHACAEDFLDSYDPAQPGCLVLDIRMPGMSGLELQDELARRGYPIPIIFITGHGDVPTAVSAVKKGAIQFLEKPFNDQVLLGFIDNAFAADARARAEADGQRSFEERLARLTQREREVLDDIVSGLRNREIAEKLGVSIKTVEAHRAKVMQKTGAASLAELVQLVHTLAAVRVGKERS